MKHHYIVLAVMWHDYLCTVGAVCAKDELNDFLKGHGVKKFKMKVVDDEPVVAWEESDWTPVH